MQWRGRRASENVEDRRSLGKAGLAIGGGGSLIILIVCLLLGVDPRQLLEQAPGVQPDGQQEARPIDPEEEERAQLVKVVLKDTEEVWQEQFRKLGRTYREPTLVLFRDDVRSGCGLARSDMGPFYCPVDEKVYIDLAFFKELKNRFKAPGDFAQAYVVAHEVGHHVQKLTGSMDKVHSLQGRAGKVQQNQASVRLELQADYLAGVWAHHAQKKFKILDPGDLEDALRAANAIGDDRLQKQTQGYVVPDSFTHGTSEQRIRWFRRGFETGNFSQADILFSLPYDDL